MKTVNWTICGLIELHIH